MAKKTAYSYIRWSTSSQTLGDSLRRGIALDCVQGVLGLGWGSAGLGWGWAGP